ncbi:MAG: preprotein translocase subunit SecG [Candidatus Hydrogenedentes bacterium]|nr:preprotein translocase subunit SecG [Candidatus Hydrogenedentota bacterium]
MFSSIYGWLWTICVALYIPACLGLIAVVLLQKGKGVGFAGAFGLGGGGADTVFGPRMSKSLPVKLTYIMAGMFLVLALTMSVLLGRITKGDAPELVETETIDMSEYEEAGIGTAPPPEGEEAPEGAPAVVDDAKVEDAPEKAVEQEVPLEPSAPVVDESTRETPTSDAGEASPSTNQ